MFISRAVIKTGLGKRVALWFISKCGSSMLGVAYGLALSDVVLGPGIPSASARAVELCTRLRSPLPRRTSQNLARRREKPAPFNDLRFTDRCHRLHHVLTAMAGNPLVAELARSRE